MSIEELSRLAPTEKLDLLNGNYNYPLKEEVTKNSDKTAASWHGICNGWSPAAINHNEPLPKTLENPDGLMIPFGSSDIKALLSYYYAFKHIVKTTHQMGKRCQFFLEPNCHDDLNAGAFHIVLSNRIGLLNSSFIADIVGGRQVWNHAVSSYKSEILGTHIAPAKNSAKGTVSRVRVKTVMTYVKGIKKNSWEPVLGTEDQINESLVYEYFLELDAYGMIIGGEWISKVRPDFIWEMEKATSFTDHFRMLSKLIND